MWTLSYHTHINRGCYDQQKLETCKLPFVGDVWVATNLGAWIGKEPNGYLTCPRGEQNICFTKTGMWGYTDGGGVRDQYEEELVRNVTKQIQHSKQPGRPPMNIYDKLKQGLSEWDRPTPGKNLFVDLMQRIAQELNITGCWICGGSQMSEQWSWGGEGPNPGTNPTVESNTHFSQREETGRMGLER